MSAMRLFSLILISLSGLLISGCLGGGQAPIYSPGDQQGSKQKTHSRTPSDSAQLQTHPQPAVKKNHYRVVRGDTLYSIAWRFRRDYKQIARWNNIRPPYLIHPGQQLRLIAPVNRVANNSGTKSFKQAVIEPMVELPPENTPPKSIQKKDEQTKVAMAKNTPKPSSQSKIKKTIPAATSNGKIKWQWPARGTILNSNTASGRNGLDIKGKMGQTIKAASAGSVVYSGSGLLGYGRLVIIKHNNSFLSAYAHNSRVLVNEGNQVLAGQPIAEMGNSGTNTVKLHFEIRKDGKSVDPRQYLPK